MRSLPGSSVAAVDQMNNFAGGISGRVPHQRLTLPVVSLPACSGSTSATIVWIAERAGQACPWFRSIDLRWKVSDVRRQLSYPHLLCSGIDVTPTVPGASDNSSKVADPASAKWRQSRFGRPVVSGLITDRRVIVKRELIHSRQRT